MSGSIEDARRRLTAGLMSRAGVSGTAIGSHRGKPCLKVYLSGKDAKKGIPSRFLGFKVVVEETGTIRPRDR